MNARIGQSETSDGYKSNKPVAKKGFESLYVKPLVTTVLLLNLLVHFNHTKKLVIIYVIETHDHSPSRNHCTNQSRKLIRTWERSPLLKFAFEFISAIEKFTK